MIRHGASYLQAHWPHVMLIVIALVPVFFIASSVLAVVGDPGSCDPAREGEGYDKELARAVDDKWHAFDDRNTGQKRVRFSEDEITARAREHVQRSRLPMSDVVICLRAGHADGSATLDLPLGLRLRVRAEAAVAMNRPHPEPGIRSIRIGGVPAILTSPFQGIVRSALIRPFGQVDLEHDYNDAIFGEGWVEIRKAD